MLTVKEAALQLGISTQRVTQLIAEGKLDAQRIGKQWLVEPESVELRARTASKGGRPRKGEGRSEEKLLLMNRTHPVMSLVYDTGRRAFSAIDEIADSKRMPIGVLGNRGKPDLMSFNAWWRGRGIPGTRAGLQRILDESGVELPEELIMRNLGLSLSDQYWIAPEDSGLRWEDINFFQNDFTKRAFADGDAQCATPAVFGAHPDNTSDGNLGKHWIIQDGLRVLLKEGGKLNQEPFNEVVATTLHQRLLSPGEYVPYRIEGHGAEAKSACSCFLSDAEEYIPAVYVDRVLPERNDQDYYLHYISCCEHLGVEGIEPALWKMIVCDDILANSDRHFRNFGIVRNVETLECRPAPIFDSGTCLWCTTSLQDLKNGEFGYESKQFERTSPRQLLLVEDMSWFDSSDLEGFVGEALEVLFQNPLLAERLPYIRASLERRVERMMDIRDWS